MKGIYVMGLFSKILEKIGIGKKDETAGAAAAAPAKPAGVSAQAKPVAKPAAPAKPNISMPSAPAHVMPSKPVAPTAISEVDVVAKLEGMSKGKGLNWKVSIVDLLKLLDIDSSLEARKELATELGCPANLMGDSAKMNTWLHKEVLKQIAANGGNIPKELLD
jgi:hypothetical protein